MARAGTGVKRLRRWGLAAHQLRTYCDPRGLQQLTAAEVSKLRSLAYTVCYSAPQLAAQARALASGGYRAHFEALLTPPQALEATPALDANPARAFVLAAVAAATAAVAAQDAGA